MNIKSGFASIEAKIDAVGKIGWALICWSVTFVLILALGVFVTHSWLLGLAAGFLAVSFIIRPFLVSVPEVTGLIAINLLKDGKKALVTYGTGLHFRYPWEQVKKGNFINLRQVTESIEETYPSMDSLMKVKWQFQYTPTCEGLPLYISADDHTIKDGLKGIGSSALGVEISKKTGEEGKRNEEEIESAMKEKFLGHKPTPKELYGIDIDRVSLSDIDYDDSVQQARSSREASRIVQETAKAIKLAHPDISDKDALNAALIINKNITKNVYEVEGIGPALAAIIDAFRGGKKS